ncbi:MAG: bifunctional nuclease domain-containing protein, partial [Bacteroidota bacterium]
IIGSFEAQAIAIELERMKPARPLTHDLFVSMAKTLGAQLKEVLITDLKEGVYFANLVWVRQEEGGKPWVQDARTSDALALAVRFACPIYTVESVLSQGGIEPEQWDAAFDPKPTTSSEPDQLDAFVGLAEDNTKGNRLSIKALEQELQDALKQEDYERAARIRDKIEQRRRGS